MKEFLIGFIVIMALFSLCMLSAYLFSVAIEKRHKKIAPKKDAKIYYIPANLKKRRQPKPKSQPFIALKGTLLNEEELKGYVLPEEVKQTTLKKRN